VAEERCGGGDSRTIARIEIGRRWCKRRLAHQLPHNQQSQQRWTKITRQSSVFHNIRRARLAECTPPNQIQRFHLPFALDRPVATRNSQLEHNHALQRCRPRIGTEPTGGHQGHPDSDGAEVLPKFGTRLLCESGIGTSFYSSSSTPRWGSGQHQCTR
jgi:hypothetical protein